MIAWKVPLRPHLLDKLKDVSKHFDKLRFQYVYREGNAVANRFAKSCVNTYANVRIIDIPDVQARNLMLRDYMSISIVNTSWFNAIKCLFYYKKL